MILGWAPERTHVFVVGTLVWKHPDRYDPFPQTRRRDVRLVDVFRAGNVPAAQVGYLQDRQATTAAIEAAFAAQLARAGAGDLVVVYFCGHGTKSDRGVPYFASYDAGDPRNVGWAVADVPKAIERHFPGSHASRSSRTACGTRPRSSTAAAAGSTSTTSATTTATTSG